MYSNGILLNFRDTEIFVLFSDNKVQIDIVIRAPNPNEIWGQIQKLIESNENVTVFVINPDHIFQNTQLFPLKLSHLPATKSTGASFENGKLGEVSQLIPYPWTYIDNIKVDTPYLNHPPLCTLELIPPVNGKWQNESHKLEFERVSNAFEYFVGVEGKRLFALEKVVLLYNPVLEQKFCKKYHEIISSSSRLTQTFPNLNMSTSSNSTPASSSNPNIHLPSFATPRGNVEKFLESWRELILLKVCSFLFSDV